MRKRHFFLVPFGLSDDRLVSAGPLPARSPEVAIRRAELLTNQFAGVGVYGVWFDDATHDASNFDEIARFGEVPDLYAVHTAA